MLGGIAVHRIVSHGKQAPERCYPLRTSMRPLLLSAVTSTYLAMSRASRSIYTTTVLVGLLAHITEKTNNKAETADPKTAIFPLFDIRRNNSWWWIAWASHTAATISDVSCDFSSRKTSHDPLNTAVRGEYRRRVRCYAGREFLHRTRTRSTRGYVHRGITRTRAKP